MVTVRPDAGEALRKLMIRFGGMAAAALLASAMFAPMTAVPAQAAGRAAPAAKVCPSAAAAMAKLPVQAKPARRAAEAAYFTVQDANGARFVIRLSDPVKIAHARDLLSGKTKERPHILGRIKKFPVPYNPGWDFHLDPDSIDFFDLAIEVCDATTGYVNDHLEEACGHFLPGCFWCPWTSRIVAENTP